MASSSGQASQAGHSLRIGQLFGQQPAAAVVALAVAAERTGGLQRHGGVFSPRVHAGVGGNNAARARRLNGATLDAQSPTLSFGSLLPATPLRYRHLSRNSHITQYYGTAGEEGCIVV